MLTHKKSLWLGFILLLVVISGIIFYSYFQKTHGPASQLTGYVGGEKINFLDSPEVKKILKDKYRLELDIRKAGSLDMVRADHEGLDFLWPSSQTALELYKAELGKPYKEDMIFTTPIVLYSYDAVAESLVDKGLAHQEDGTYWLDLAALLEMIKEDKRWSDLGLDLFGEICIHTTNPAQSNSGNMFSGLAANLLHAGQVVRAQDVASLKPQLEHIFNKLGYMSTSSSDLFSLYLRNGMGDKTLCAGYENQLLEFSRLEAENWQALQNDLCLIYPEPTVWSTHILIALNEQGARLLEALKDPQIQELAWREHGFRSSHASTDKASQAFPEVPGLAETIRKILPMPDYQAMSKIIEIFQ